MFLMLLLLGLLALVTIFLPWAHAFQLKALKAESRELSRELYDLKREFSLLKHSGKAEGVKPVPVPEAHTSFTWPTPQSLPASYERPAYREPAPIEEIALPPQQTEPHIQPQTQPPRSHRKISDFEHNIGTKLPVWLGAISLVCAAFFLVKYSIEAGWLGPLTRVAAGGLFGAGLLAAGQWLTKRVHIANAARMAQGLVGAGIVTLYVSLYAAVSLYHLLPSLIGFVGMTAVTAMAVIMSLRHGQPIAVFGVLGGLLTPVLVGSQEPNAILLFTYLFLLFSGMFFVLARKGWWILAMMALWGIFGWVTFWYAAAFAATDAHILVLFVMAITMVVLFVTGRRIVSDEIMTPDTGRSLHSLNVIALAGSVLAIAFLGIKVTLTLFDWSMMGLLTLALMAMTYFQPAVYRNALWLKMAVGFALFAFWADDAPLVDAVAVLAGMSVLYGVVPAILMRRVADPRFWSGLQCVAAVSLYVISYYVLELPESFTTQFALFWGVLSLILASFAIRQVSIVLQYFKESDVIRDYLVAFYTLAATTFISLGMAIELPWEYVPMAFAAQIAATAWIYDRTGIAFLKSIIMALAAIFACMNYEQIFMFGNHMLASIFDYGTGYRRSGSVLIDAPLIKMGIPVILIACAAAIAVKRDREDRAFVQPLFGMTFILLTATLYYMARGFVHGDYAAALSTEAGFVERGMITAFVAATGILILRLHERLDMSFLKPWGLLLIHTAMARLIYFDLFMHNPVLSPEQRVGGTPILNGVTLTYGTGVALATWMVYSRYCAETLRAAYKPVSFVLLFTLISLTVRQLFHGSSLSGGPVAIAEYYSYSFAWLVTGLALLSFGILMRSKTARVASLGFLVLTVLKVFLLDTAELEGLYRVFSFLGLGTSLIGLSYFYTKFVFAQEKRQEAEKEEQP